MYYAPTLDSMCTTRLRWTPCVLRACTGLHVYYTPTLDSTCTMLDPCVLCWIHVYYAGLHVYYAGLHVYYNCDN